MAAALIVLFMVPVLLLLLVTVTLTCVSRNGVVQRQPDQEVELADLERVGEQTNSSDLLNTGEISIIAEQIPAGKLSKRDFGTQSTASLESERAVPTGGECD